MRLRVAKKVMQDPDSYRRTTRACAYQVTQRWYWREYWRVMYKPEVEAAYALAREIARAHGAYTPGQAHSWGRH